MSKKEILFGTMLLIIDTYGENIYLQFILATLLLCVFMIMKKFRVPKTQYLVPIFLIFAIGFINSIFFQENFLFSMRDTIYFLTPILILINGYYIANLVRKKNLDFVKMFVYAVSLNIIYRLIKIVINVSGSNLFDLIRNQARGIELTLPLVIAILFFYKSYTSTFLFTKKIDFFLVIFNCTFLLMSISRTGIVNLIVCISVFYFINLKRNKMKIKLNITPILLTGVIAILILLIPSEVKLVLFSKFQNTFTELNSQNNWNNINDIVSNWRGYEISVASELYLDGNLYNKVFGFGFGELIPVKYSYLVGVPISDGGITILHNGYYHILIKAGLIGIILYIFFFLNIIIKGSFNRNSLNEAILLCLSLIYIISSFVITGLFFAPAKVSVLLFMAFLLENRKKRNLERKVRY